VSFVLNRELLSLRFVYQVGLKVYAALCEGQNTAVGKNCGNEMHLQGFAAQLMF